MDPLIRSHFGSRKVTLDLACIGSARRTMASLWFIVCLTRLLSGFTAVVLDTNATVTDGLVEAFRLEPARQEAVKSTACVNTLERLRGMATELAKHTKCERDRDVKLRERQNYESAIRSWQDDVATAVSMKTTLIAAMESDLVSFETARNTIQSQLPVVQADKTAAETQVTTLQSQLTALGAKPYQPQVCLVSPGPSLSRNVLYEVDGWELISDQPVQDPCAQAINSSLACCSCSPTGGCAFSSDPACMTAYQNVQAGCVADTQVVLGMRTASQAQLTTDLANAQAAVTLKEHELKTLQMKTNSGRQESRNNELLWPTSVPSRRSCHSGRT